MEYEFTIMLDLDTNHIASASKDRTNTFDGIHFKPTIETGVQLAKWLDSGIEPAPSAHLVLFSKLDAAANEEELTNLIPELAGLPDTYKDEGRKKFAAKKATFVKS
jgi:hypothetical protein